jgi:hypothetical protein
MSIAAEKLPLPRRDVRQKKLPHRCHDATAYKKILPRRYRDAMAYKLAAAAMVFKKMFQISLLRLYWTRNLGIRPSDSFSLRVFHL